MFFFKFFKIIQGTYFQDFYIIVFFHLNHFSLLFYFAINILDSLNFKPSLVSLAIFSLIILKKNDHFSLISKSYPDPH